MLDKNVIHAINKNGKKYRFRETGNGFKHMDLPFTKVIPVNKFNDMFTILTTREEILKYSCNKS